MLCRASVKTCCMCASHWHSTDGPHRRGGCGWWGVHEPWLCLGTHTHTHMLVSGFTQWCLVFPRTRMESDLVLGSPPLVLDSEPTCVAQMANVDVVFCWVFVAITTRIAQNLHETQILKIRTYSETGLGSMNEGWKKLSDLARRLRRPVCPSSAAASRKSSATLTTVIAVKNLHASESAGSIARLFISTLLKRFWCCRFHSEQRYSADAASVFQG